MARMLGKTGQPFCGSHCCGDTTKKHQRQMKRSERQKAQKEIRSFLTRPSTAVALRSPSGVTD